MTTQPSPTTDAVDGEIYAELVETLFATPRAFVAGLVAGLLTPIVAFFTTGDSIYFSILLLMFCLAVYRLGVFTAFQRAPATQRRRDAAQWERRYAIGSVGYMTAVGVCVAVLFADHHDEMIAYYGVLMLTGCVASFVGRNAGRPRIVLGETLGACGPLAIAALFNFNVWYWGLALILLLVAVSIDTTTGFVHANLTAALRNGHDARRQRKIFHVALDSMSHGLCMGRKDLTITVVNRRVFEFFGIVAAATPIRVSALASAIGRNMGMEPTESAAFARSWESHAMLPKASVFSAKIGERTFDFRCEPAEAGGFVTVIEDVTVEREAAQRIEHAARHDALTDLPNRHAFQQRLDEALERAVMHRRRFALLALDLDHFKEVNDTLGHLVGDSLLCAVAQRLSALTRESDVVSRFGGDEFCILLDPCDAETEVEALAQRIIRAIEAPFLIDGRRIVVGASLGMCLAPRDAATSEELLKRGDLALYAAKAEARGEAMWFDPRMEDALARKRELIDEMRCALDAGAGEFVPYYQPVVDARHGNEVCREALLRWRSETRGLVSPGDFIPVAEETGMIVELGAHILRRACEDATRWPSEIRVAVNLSPKQFQQGDIVATVAGILADSGLPPGRLELEITETTLMLDTRDVAAKVEALAALGAHISLDDFGTGYSSLSYLSRFPVKKIKIDQCFARGLLTSTKTLAIVGALAQMAQELGIELVAEGVETHAQLAQLAGKNIFLIQGFLFGRPAPLEEFPDDEHVWKPRAAVG